MRLQMHNDNFSTKIAEKDQKLAKKYETAERLKQESKKEMKDYI